MAGLAWILACYTGVGGRVDGIADCTLGTYIIRRAPRTSGNSGTINTGIAISTNSQSPRTLRTYSISRALNTASNITTNTSITLRTNNQSPRTLPTEITQHTIITIRYLTTQANIAIESVLAGTGCTHVIGLAQDAVAYAAVHACVVEQGC